MGARLRRRAARTATIAILILLLTMIVQGAVICKIGGGPLPPPRRVAVDLIPVALLCSLFLLLPRLYDRLAAPAPPPSPRLRSCFRAAAAALFALLAAFVAGAAAVIVLFAHGAVEAARAAFLIQLASFAGVCSAMLSLFGIALWREIILLGRLLRAAGVKKNNVK